MNPFISKTNSTPQDTPSFIKSCLIGLLVFMLLFVGLEFGYRTALLNDFLPVRSIGSYHTQFELKLFKLRDYVAKYGGVDVIIIGNSMVNTGIIPGEIANEYESSTGNQLRIFNFGIEGLTISPISDISQYLANKYHPGTLLVFTEMRDYVHNNGEETEETFDDNAWIQNQLGNWSIEGTLADHSYALQHFLSLRNWSRSDFLDSYNLAYNRLNAISETGYEEDSYTATTNSLIREPDPSNVQDAILFKEYQNYKMALDRIEDLKNILALQNEGTKVILSEMPVYPSYFIYFGDARVRQKYLTTLNRIANQSHSLFVPPVNPSIIPLDGRSDNHHLNYKGAPIYSEALGVQLGSLCSQRGICLNYATGPTTP